MSANILNTHYDVRMQLFGVDSNFTLSSEDRFKTAPITDFLSQGIIQEYATDVDLLVYNSNPIDISWGLIATRNGISGVVLDGIIYRKVETSSFSGSTLIKIPSIVPLGKQPAIKYNIYFFPTEELKTDYKYTVMFHIMGRVPVSEHDKFIAPLLH